jgi:dTDP-4-dehydrorhamnose 3,5-epimerase
MDGVALISLRQFSDERGSVMHFLRSDAPHFKAFGEIYFSTVFPGKVKAWHSHTRKTVNLAVPVGEMRLVLFDGRSQGETSGELIEVILSPSNYQLLSISPGVWYGFQCLGAVPAFMANCATEPYEPAEGRTLPHDTSQIPYRWSLT